MKISTHKSANFGGLPERRGTSRFPVREDVRYRIVHSKTEIVSGSGTTLNISSGGILFTTAEKLPVGSRVDLSVNWPARLDGTCRLQFVVAGRVVRAESKRAVVQIDRYEFRTRPLNGSFCRLAGVELFA
jgi:c-di-GMP-binding flagellar brake protein YcgR